MGWLGWTETESLEADVNSILIAMEGKLEMMYPEATKKLERSRGTVASRFKAFAKSHNAAIAKKAKEK